MRVIEIRRSQKFGGCWSAAEAPGVAPAFPGPNGKQSATDYARGRFGGSRGEIHVYDDAGQNIVEKITIDGGSHYGQASTAK